MKAKSNILRIIVVALVLFQDNLRAQTFSDLYDFNSLNYPGTNATQFEPSGDLIMSAGVLYGVTYQGGSDSQGGVYSINLDGTDFNALCSFKNSPSQRLTLLSGILYAPTLPSSTSGGNIVSEGTNGGPSKVIYQFTGTGDGVFPTAIASAGNMLFGTTMFSNSLSGSFSFSGPGTIYSINTNDDSFTLLHTFNQTQGGQWLTLSAGTLYGAAGPGSVTDSPTNCVLFSIATNGDNYTNLYTFTNGILAGWLVIDQDMLYGVAQSNSVGGYVFSMETNGSNFSVLHVFTNGTPNDLIMLNNNLLCGASIADGLYNGGTIYSMETNGSGYNVLYNFPEYRGDGFAGASGLVSNGNTLLGTTQLGGTNSFGSIYSLNLAPTIQSVTSTNGYLNMVWNTAGGAYYKFQYSTSVSGANWLDLTGIFTATNQTVSIADPITDTQRFYRLIYQP